MIEEMLDLWVSQAVGRGVLLTDKILKQKRVQFTDLCKIPEDDCTKQSNGWVSKYKRRMNLKSYKRHGEGGSTDAAVIEEKHQHIQKLIEKSGYVLRDILNMNETGLFMHMHSTQAFTNLY